MTEQPLPLASVSDAPEGAIQAVKPLIGYCRQCGGVFPASCNRNGKWRLFCGRACNLAWHNAYTKQARIERQKREGRLDFSGRTPLSRHTSQQAAATVAHPAPDRARILAYLRACGEVGATDEQIQEALDLSGNTERPRRGELLTSGQVQAVGTRATQSGRQAAVWVVPE